MDIQQAFDSLVRYEQGEFINRNYKQLTTDSGLNRPRLEDVNTYDIVYHLLNNVTPERLLESVITDFDELKEVLCQFAEDEYLEEITDIEE